jgi:hypothetical protein
MEPAGNVPCPRHGSCATGFFVAAGMCTYEEPLFAVEDAWEYVLAHVSPGVAKSDADGVDTTEDAEDSVDSPDVLGSVRRALEQALSTWLNSDAVPTPQVVVRLARGMGRPVRELMTAAGFAPADDPLLDTADAWAYVRGEVGRALGVGAEDMAEPETGHDAPGPDAAGVATVTAVPAPPETREAFVTLLRQLQARALMVTKASVPTPEDPLLASTALDTAGASDAISAEDEATDERP